MKKALAIILAVVMIITAVPMLLAGCGSESKKLVVGFDSEFPPYGYKDDNGEYTGFDLEVAEAVCKELGWELVKQPIDWNSKDMELNSGTIDCIWNGFTIQGREDDYTFSKPYVDNSQVVVVKKGSDIKSLGDLKGKVVAVQDDSSALEALTGEDATDANKKLCASFKELQKLADYNNALMNLDAGSVDAVCMDIGVASYNIKNNADKYTQLSDIISTEQYGIGFKKGNTELKDKVEKTLLEMSKDGTVEKIAKEYKLEDALCLGK